ncbi:hypothetical protein INT47_006461 [Mucor saturninus]|uniref:Uncharacterized protein n=1 Tax=Mucor saturninus TaxID=64648 RepID=A0A8H7QM29_9FUNG|nr:hypothetical protein INT47_006461 [Mucor saturninus]
MSQSEALDSGCFKKLVKGMNLEQVSAAQPVNVEVLKRFGWSITRALTDEEKIFVSSDMVSYETHKVGQM